MKDGLPATKEVIESTLTGLGYRGTLSQGVDMVTAQIKLAQRFKGMENRIQQMRGVLADSVLMNQARQDVRNSLNTDVSALTNLRKYADDYSRVNNVDDLAEMIAADWEKTGPVMGNTAAEAMQRAKAHTYAEEVMKLRNQNLVKNPVEKFIDDLFYPLGRGQRADIERYTLAALAQGADNAAIEAMLKRYGMPDTLVTESVIKLAVQVRTPAIRRAFSFFERFAGVPGRIEDQVLQDLISRNVPVTNTTEISNALKQAGYPLTDSYGRGQNLQGALTRVRNRLNDHYTGGSARGGARTTAQAGQPAPHPVPARPPKTKYSAWERLFNKRGSYESIARNEVMRGAIPGNDLDAIKNRLRQLGVVESEIDTMAARIQQQFNNVQPSAPRQQPPAPQPVPQPPSSSQQHPASTIPQRAADPVQPLLPGTKTYTAAALDTPGRATSAISDWHGDVQRARELLKDAQYIDDQGHWIAGESNLVILGDLVDRGPQGAEAIEFAMKLEQEATAHGGKVIVLTGNHDVFTVAATRMIKDTNLESELQQVVQEGLQARAAADRLVELANQNGKQISNLDEDIIRTYFTTDADRYKSRKGYIDYNHGGVWIGGNPSDLSIIASRDDLIDWLSRRDAIQLVDGDLYMHANDYDLYHNMGNSINEINAKNRQNLSNKQSAFEYAHKFNYAMTQTQARQMIQDLTNNQARRIIHGHERQTAVIIQNNLIINIDGSMSIGYQSAADRGVIFQATKDNP